MEPELKPRQSRRSVFDAFAAVVQVIATVAIAALVALVLAEVISRSLFGTSLNLVEEVAGYLVVVITFLGAALAMRDGSLFRVGFVYDCLPAGLRRALGVVYLLVSLGVTCVLIRQTALVVISSYERGKVAATALMTPIWLPQLAMPIGLAVIAIFLLEHAVAEIKRGV